MHLRFWMNYIALIILSKCPTYCRKSDWNISSGYLDILENKVIDIVQTPAQKDTL